jgi:hypothetical protein
VVVVVVAVVVALKERPVVGLLCPESLRVIKSKN